MESRLMAYIKLMRIHQYIKNLFIFAPLFFTFNFSVVLLEKTFLVFICFSLIASAIYIFNDYRDIENDRLHPKKKYRPLASGKIKTSNALLFAGFLLVIAGGGAIFLFNWKTAFIVSSYIVINFAYSFYLKHIAILDVCVIAVGFILRLMIGSNVAQVELSHWIIITTFFLSLFLAFSKRRDDLRLLQDDGIKTRKSIDGYSLLFVDFCVGVSATMSIFAYVMWSIDESSMERIGSSYLYLTSFFVVLGIIRYAQNVYVRFSGGSPTSIVLKDIFMHCILLGWILSFVFLIGGNNE